MLAENGIVLLDEFGTLLFEFCVAFLCGERRSGCDVLLMDSGIMRRELLPAEIKVNIVAGVFQIVIHVCDPGSGIGVAHICGWIIRVQSKMIFERTAKFRLCDPRSEMIVFGIGEAESLLHKNTALIFPVDSTEKNMNRQKDAWELKTNIADAAVKDIKDERKENHKDGDGDCDGEDHPRAL